MKAPPAWATRLLGVALPKTERDSVLADLSELYTGQRLGDVRSLARIRDGVTAAQVRAAVDAVARDLDDTWGNPGHGLRLATLGLVVGIGGSLALAPALKSATVGLQASDPWVYLAVVVSLLASR